MPVTLTFPKKVAIAADVELHGEDVVVQSDYTLDGNFQHALFNDWKYNDDGENIVSTGTVNMEMLKSSLETTLFGSFTSGDADIRAAGAATGQMPFGNRLLEIIAFNLFKHPLATAPISNDAAIKEKGADVASLVKASFDTDDEIRISLVEQLMSQDASRFEGDHSEPTDVPLLAGDAIQFMVHYTGATKSNSSVLAAQNTDFDVTSTKVLGSNLAKSILVKLVLL